jgi:hypothetical protein
MLENYAPSQFDNNNNPIFQLNDEHVHSVHTVCNCLNVNFPGQWIRDKKGKAITVTGRGGPYGCETSRLPHFLDNWLTYDGEVASLTRPPLFTPRNMPGNHFC